MGFIYVIIVLISCTYLVENSFKASMKNDMLDFNDVIKFFVLILVRVKFFVLFLLDGNSLHQAGLKLTLMGYPGLATCGCRYFPLDYGEVY